MNIKEIALRIDGKLSADGLVATSGAYAIEFATALLAELSKDAEPVAWRIRFKSGKEPEVFMSVHYHGTNAIADYRVIDPDAVSDALYTHPQPVEAIEQRVAEACAKYVHRKVGVLGDVDTVIEGMNSGEWREFVNNDSAGRERNKPELICPRCKVDRFKVPCPGPLHMCPIIGEAQ